MATSILRKTEEQLKLHLCRLQIWQSTAALQVLGQDTDGVHLATSPGMSLGAGRDGGPAHVPRSLSISSGTGSTLDAVSALRMVVVPLRPAGTRQGVFRSGTIEISAMRHHQSFSRT